MEKPSNEDQDLNDDDIKKGLLSRNSGSDNDDFTPPEPTSNKLMEDSKN